MAQARDLAARILAGLSPVLFVAGLLAVAAWRDRQAAGATARQIRLTDALAEGTGPIVAPVVKWRCGAGAS
jgi:hypothetical protein